MARARPGLVPQASARPVASGGPGASSPSGSPPIWASALLSYDPALRWRRPGGAGRRGGTLGRLGAVHGGRLRRATSSRVLLMAWAFAAVDAAVRRGHASTSVGAGLGLLAVTGLLARFSGPVRRRLAPPRRVAGLGRRRARSGSTLGDLGALVLLLTLIAVAGLCITQALLRGPLADDARRRVTRLARALVRPPAPAAAPALPVARPRAPVVAEPRPAPPAPAIALPGSAPAAPSGPRRPAPGARSGRDPRRTGRPRARRPAGRRPPRWQETSSASPSPARRSSCRPWPSSRRRRAASAGARRARTSSARTPSTSGSGSRTSG